MVFKIAGWVLSFEQVRIWLEKQGHDHKELEDEFLMVELNHWFEKRGIDQYLWAVCTDYPRGSKQPVIVLARRRREDPKSMVSYYYRVRETDTDRQVKKQVLEESGLVDENLPWVTVADPLFQC